MPQIPTHRLKLRVKPLLPHQPTDLLAQQQLQALEKQLTRLVASQVFALVCAGLALLAGDAAGLAKIVVFVDVELDITLFYLVNTNVYCCLGGIWRRKYSE
jgi:hypothetical protein